MIEVREIRGRKGETIRFHVKNPQTGNPLVENFVPDETVKNS
ncbi:MAG: hypothetical protein V1911_03755 [Candidatus Micrarchaeota archaeon]